MVKWSHKVSLDWLKARKRFITATDIKELLPVTATGRKRSVTNANYLKVLSSKMKCYCEDDCISTGAAARGHVLEPYAIDLYNHTIFNPEDVLYHWDDAIVTSGRKLAFSPDACNVKQFGETVVDDSEHKITRIGEVKSYSAEKHTICGHTPKMELEERWQIAAAMAVCDSIEEAVLIFFNPSMEDQMYTVVYDRDDLNEEINTCLEIESNFIDFMDNYTDLNPNNPITLAEYSESEIIEDIIEKESLNPENMKSVVV